MSSQKALKPGSSFSLSQLYRDAHHHAQLGLSRAKPLIKPLALCGLVLAASSTMAADWDIPGVSGIDGLADADDPGEMIRILGKWFLKVVVWIGALGMGALVIRNIIRSINKVHRDEDGKWSAVIGEIVGNIAVFLAVLAIAAWLLSKFT